MLYTMHARPFTRHEHLSLISWHYDCTKLIGHYPGFPYATEISCFRYFFHFIQKYNLTIFITLTFQNSKN